MGSARIQKVRIEISYSVICILSNDVVLQRRRLFAEPGLVEGQTYSVKTGKYCSFWGTTRVGKHAF